METRSCNLYELAEVHRRLLHALYICIVLVLATLIFWEDSKLFRSTLLITTGLSEVWLIFATNAVAKQFGKPLSSSTVVLCLVLPGLLVTAATLHTRACKVFKAAGIQVGFLGAKIE